MQHKDSLHIRPSQLLPSVLLFCSILATGQLLHLSGCGSGEFDNPNGGGPCYSMTHCEPGFVCESGECVPATGDPCTITDDCVSGYVCWGGVCVQDTLEACSRSDDCRSGHVCESGVCVPEVQGECSRDSDCVENAQCLDSAQGAVCVCKEYYYNSSGTCLPETRVVDCASLKPENASWDEEYSAGRLTQTWDGTTFSPAASSCAWSCNHGFHEHNLGDNAQCVQCLDNSHCEAPTAVCALVSNSCVACLEHQHCPDGHICLAEACEQNPRTFACPPRPLAGTEWNTVSEYSQEWNHAHQRWEPEASETLYNESPSTTSCRFKCAQGYRWNGNACEVRPSCITGTHLGGHVLATDLLNAMDICDVYDGTEGSFGILPGTARIARANYPNDHNQVDNLQYGVKTGFGTDSTNAPMFGDNMAVLSSGRARDASDPNGTAWKSYPYQYGNPPADFVAPHSGQLPATRAGCPRGTGANDSVNLMVQLKVPDFANAFSFDFRFFSQEYQGFTCTDFNDFFITMLDTSWQPAAGEQSIPADKNISFDSARNYISVNSDQFFTVCVPKTCSVSGVFYPCPGGTSPLEGTGYQSVNAGATAWLTTTAPVVPGETITLRFIIWDTSDQLLDSLVLLDNFRWHAESGGAPTTCLKPAALCATDDQCCSRQCVFEPDAQFGVCL